MSRDAAEILRRADALVIGAGAGMGVDSGLPDFRGDQGFWKAYPPYAELGLGFSQLANPRWFANDPELAWGFYGHRLNLYRKTIPHAGFALLAKWASKMKHGAFVYTSNVDGQFQRAGFAPERVLEIHGAIEQLQCTARCGRDIWLAAAEDVAVDEQTFRAAPPHPACPKCGKLARPNVLMFGDSAWDEARTHSQETRLDAWLAQAQNVVVVECGAGTAIPSVRMFCETTARKHATPLVRVNPRESDGPKGTISIATGALAGLSAIDAQLGQTA